MHLINICCSLVSFIGAATLLYDPHYWMTEERVDAYNRSNYDFIT